MFNIYCIDKLLNVKGSCGDILGYSGENALEIVSTDHKNSTHNILTVNIITLLYHIPLPDRCFSLHKIIHTF